MILNGYYIKRGPLYYNIEFLYFRSWNKIKPFVCRFLFVAGMASIKPSKAEFVFVNYLF